MKTLLLTLALASIALGQTNTGVWDTDYDNVASPPDTSVWTWQTAGATDQNHTTWAQMVTEMIADITTEGSFILHTELQSVTDLSAQLGMIGTPGPTTYFRGDGRWEVPPGGGGGSGDVTAAAVFPTDTGIIVADGAGGKGVKGTGILISDTNVMSGIDTITVTTTNATALVIDSVTVTATGTELNYVDGVTSAIQNQLDEKVESDVTGVAGADAVVNIISLTQAEYDAIGAPDASTFYVITGP